MPEAGGDTLQLLLIGLLAVSGLVAGTAVAAWLNLPRVVAYILVGLVFSPDLLGGWLGVTDLDWTRPLVSVALGVIAYLIGGSITVGQLRRLGWTIVGATLGEVSGAFLAVFAAVLVAGITVADLPVWLFALVLGAIAPATAPAAIVAVLHQYRARGPLTTTLLGMVAIDDALGILIFALVMAVAGSASLGSALPAALYEIGVALLVGGMAAFLLERLTRRFHETELRLVAVLGGLILLVGLAGQWGFSALLAAMAFGFATRYFRGPAAEQLFQPVENLEELVFVLFFTVAGMHFQVAVFEQYLGLMLLYFFARGVGLMAGANIGSRLAGAPRQVSRWVGFGLLPQGGVAIGLALLLSGNGRFAQAGELIVNVVTATTLITESVGAVAARYGLRQAGELGRKRARGDG